jgi:Flp pilus assembly protein TadB
MDEPRDFLTGMIMGAIAGAALGLLFAPHAGKRTRERMREKSEDLTGRARYQADRVAERIRRSAEDLAERVRQRDEAPTSVEWVGPQEPAPPQGPAGWGGPQKPPEPPPPFEFERG